MQVLSGVFIPKDGMDEGMGMGGGSPPVPPVLSGFFFICQPETAKNEPKCPQDGMKMMSSILRESMSQSELCWKKPY